MKKTFLIGSLSILVTACGGGTIGGLFPAPKILDGSLDGTRYTSPDKVLSVTAPVSTKASAWLYTSVKEHSQKSDDQSSRFVGFKPPYDSHFYSVEVVDYANKSPLSEEQFQLVVDNTIKRVINSSEERWKTESQELTDSELLCADGSKMTYTVYKQPITSQSQEFVKYYLLSLTHKENAVAVITSELNYEKSYSNTYEADLTSVNYAKHNEMACSLEVNI